jgi:hypothetical protein
MLRIQRGQGVSVAELARMLDRSPRMVNKILRGETSGEAYRAAVTQLHERGQVTTPPARRRAADGHLVGVRGAAGQVVTPQEAPRPKRGRFSEQMTPMAGGARQYHFTAPKTRDAKGRERANATIVSRLRSAAKGQRWDRKKVKFRIALSNGHSMDVGSKHGYQVSSVLGRSRGGDFAGDALGWLKTQAQHRYPDMDARGIVITDLTMTVYNHRDESEF